MKKTKEELLDITTTLTRISFKRIRRQRSKIALNTTSSAGRKKSLITKKP
jgi:hypothetical protein